MRSLIIVLGISLLVACDSSEDVPDAPVTPPASAAPAAPPSTEQPAAPKTGKDELPAAPCTPPISAGSFTADAGFRLTTHVEVSADLTPERQTKTGDAYYSQLTLVFVEASQPTTDASGATGLKRGYVRYRMTVNASTPQGDAFTPGPEREVAVHRSDEGSQMCLTQGNAKGGGLGSTASKDPPVPGTLLITRRTADTVEGTLTSSDGAKLSFVAPIRSGGTMPSLCCS